MRRLALALAATLALAPTAPLAAQEDGAAVGHSSLDLQVKHVHRLTSRLRRARPDVFPSPEVPGSPALGEGSVAERLARRLDHELDQLALTLAMLRAAERGAMPAPLESRVDVTGREHDARLALDAADVQPDSLELVNEGPHDIVDPRVELAGASHWFDAPDDVRQRVALRLRPGERVVRRWSHPGLHPDDMALLGALPVHGSWIHEAALGDARQPPVEVQFELPYGIVGGVAHVHFESISTRSDWVVEARLPDGEWVAARWGQPIDRVFPADLAGLVTVADAPPSQQVAVRLRPTHAEAAGRVGWMRVELDVQQAPAQAPELDGTTPTARWSSASDEARASLTLRYRPKSL